MSKKEIEKFFPPLTESGYEITSPATPDYNCIAWAAENNEAWWEPDPLNLSYWPLEISRTYTLESYIKVYETLGYAICEDAQYEEGFEKIAIYIDSRGKPTHAARQLNFGKWTSKLGSLEDIEHPTLEDLTGQDYGSVAAIMKRIRKKSI